MARKEEHSMSNSPSRKIIQSVQRAVDIINCFNNVNTELGLSQISQMLGLNKSTIHGILNTLHRNGYIHQNSNGKYLLGRALFSKGLYAHRTNRSLLKTVADPHMQQLSNQYKVTTNLFTIEDGWLMVVHQVFPVDGVYIVDHVSDNDPYYCTASGKVVLRHMEPDQLKSYLDTTELVPFSTFTITNRDALLKNLEEIRKDGYSYESEELGEGISAVSVPIYDKGHKLFGTISATGISYHIVRNKKALAENLLIASQNISEEISKHLYS